MSNRTRYSSRARAAALDARAQAMRFLALALLGITLAVVAVSAASAQNRLLDQYRAAGTVGERFDGYAVVRAPNAPAAVQQEVASVNAQRKQVYQQRAAQQGIGLPAVGKIYAAEIFKAAPPGTWFLQENGQWVRK